MMIGRGALSTPWIFREAWAALNGQPLPPTPTEGEKIAVIRRYLALMLEFRDEHYAMYQIRRRISWFGKRLGPCKPLRERVRVAAGVGDVLDALAEFEAGGLRSFFGAGGGSPDESELAGVGDGSEG